jgi:hypothetical protein
MDAPVYESLYSSMYPNIHLEYIEDPVEYMLLDLL